MGQHNSSRRKFLVNAAVGAGAVAGAGIAPALPSQEHEAAEAGQAAHESPGHGAFFNRDQALAVAALSERIMPGASGKPGATDAGVLNYIDLALAGAYADQQDFYRRGVAQLDAHCRKRYKEPFARLAAAQQDEVISALEKGQAPEFEWPAAQAFFNTVRTHTMEGMFADPLYGGNKGLAGWRLVGFPGAQAYYTTKDMESKEAFTRAPARGM